MSGLGPYGPLRHSAQHGFVRENLLEVVEDLAYWAILVKNGHCFFESKREGRHALIVQIHIELLVTDLLHDKSELAEALD